ncbi:MAG: hypothetical protein GAK43_01696 [Stenotrophomonas maltophilia]|nr:MAG: hypothetical protein GAK43_01696 [Stenotrophomonas maltophilia]
MQPSNGLDREGFIARLPASALQVAFEPLLDELRIRLVDALGPALHSLYLYGSVARGEATPGVSDLDVTLVLAQAADAPLRERLEAIRAELQRQFPQVSKVDFDIGHLAQALAPANRLSWGYWLRHQCRCVYGEDLGARFTSLPPSRAIALALNGDARAVLEEYAAAIEAAAPTERLRLQREAARKALRATQVVRSDADDDWPLSLEQHAEWFLARYPEQREATLALLEQARSPSTSAEFSALLRRFGRWLAETAGLA